MNINITQILIASALGIVIGLLIVFRKDRDYSNITKLSVNDFTNNMRKGQLIDIRKQDAYEQDKIKGARNFRPGELTKTKTKLRRDLPVYLYCQNGKKSARVAKKLSRDGYEFIYVLHGGLDAYNNEQ